MRQIVHFFLIGSLLMNVVVAFAEGRLPDNISKKMTQQKNDSSVEDLIEISPEGQRAAGIQIQTLQAKSLPIYLSLPGEVIPNADQTVIVTPRIQAQVIERLVQVGDHVNKGQPLVHLSSVDMSKAQANLLLASKEWKRVKSLGKQTVSVKRYQTAEVAYQQASSRLLAYGMTRAQIKSFIKSNDPNKANGDFTLLARRDGTIFSADFTEGEMIDPGRVLFKIVDETSLWVDAKLSNGESTKIEKGAKAIIQTANYKLTAHVLQVHHKLDKTTRTRVVRLNVPNPKDQLHPGEFVTCLIKIGETRPVLAVNATALMRTPGGDTVVYVEVKPNHFQAQEIQVIKTVGPWRIIKGIEPGVRIVKKGAFFVHSESLKRGFSRHNH